MTLRAHLGPPVALATSVVALLLIVPPAALAEEVGVEPHSQSLPDSSASVQDEPAQVKVPARGGDIRRVRASGAVAAVAPPPGVRCVGSGWDGHRVSLARGAGPAALTEVTLRGRPAGDWVDGGLDLLAVSSPAAGVVLTPNGPDLSVWPVYTAEWPGVLLDSTAPLVIDQMPLRRPGTVPFSRLTMASGSFGRSLLAAEFGRHFSGGSAVTGYFEAEDGRSPSAGGSYGFDRTGGSVLLPVRDGWVAELGGTRTSLSRSRPAPDAALPSLSREYVRTDLFVRGSTGNTHVELFHTQSWLESGSPGPEARAELDGLSARVSDLGPVDMVTVVLERREVAGALVSETQEAVSFRADVAEGYRLGPNSLSVTAGVHALGDHVLPRAGAVLAGERSRGDAWSIEASLCGRHPTALELALEPRSLPELVGTDALVGGNARVEPERAVSLSATYSRQDVLEGAGVRGEILRVLGPIILDEYAASCFAPVNVADETGGALSVWAAAGDTSFLSGALDVSFLGLHAAGALNGLTPVPYVSAEASGSVPVWLFKDYLRLRITASLEYESGLARGPWRGLVDDTRASLSLIATGAAGSARFFVAVTDVLSTDSGRIPGMEPGGTTVAAGFSWRFID